MAGEGVAVDQRMSGCATFDFSQANQIASFEVAVAVFKFPQRRVWRTGMEHIAHCRSMSAIAPD